MVNILRYTKRLEDLGLSRELAETHVQILAEVIEGDVATKQDLNQTKEGLEHKILQMEYRLTIKMGAMMTIAVGVIISALKILLA